MPGLTGLLQAARESPAPPLDPETQTLAWFGWDAQREGDLPIAALEQETTADGYWLKADPVILHPDRDRLLLFDGVQADYTPEETQALVAAMNETFAPLGGHCRDGYLRLPADPGLVTTPLRHALGRSVDRLLPRGRDAARLHGRLTELEMQLHAHSVNQARRARGRATVDGVWLWGGGERPVLQARPFARVFDDRILMRRLAGDRCAPVPADAAALLAELTPGENLLTLTDLDQAQIYGDVRAWLTQLPELDARWLQPLSEALRARRMDRLTLLAGNGRRYVSNAGRRRRWPRWFGGKRRPWTDYVGAA